MKTDQTIFKDKGFIIGLILIPISFIIHLLLSFLHEDTNVSFMNEDGIFYINYIISVVYFIILIVNRVQKKHNYQKYICSLILFSISCFTINMTFPIFSNFGAWVNIYLVLMHMSLLGLCFNDLLPKTIKTINFFVLGLGSILALYFTIYLIPFSIIGVIGAFFFGLSLHLLVPAFILITIIVQFIRRDKNKLDKLAFYIGALIPLVILSFYLFKWDTTKKLIHKTQASIITRPDNKLPNWVLLSQELDNGFFTERILKGNLVYETNLFSDAGFFSGPRNSLSETKEHDPLVVIGSELMGSINLSSDERIKILESKFDLRHQTKRKLWSGEHLSTSSVLSNIQVFPDYRLAYTEKIIRIKNNNQRNWSREEEALYTFHLPEGSVATSLSLWIDGKEEKSRLTTKSKADSAYTTIVGVERRDPSILHWQEGNTITVYVFPCTKEEERMFKIGITTPLKLNEDQLVLENIYFEGPDASKALETTIIEFITEQQLKIKLPNSFDEILPNKFQYDGNYNSYWEAKCNTIPIANNTFSFNGMSYQITEAKDQTQQILIDNIYLDINQSWTKDEFYAVLETIKEKKVFVFYDKIYSLNENNKDDLYDLLHHLNFSLFPLNKIEDQKHSLLISKSSTLSPTLEDLKQSEFIDDLKEYLEERQDRINIFNLSDQLSPYLKTLKEFQVFNYAQGETSKLKTLIDQHIYINDEQNDNTAHLRSSNTIISRDSLSTISSAPDHLLRLFAYNKIMQECGRNYFVEGNFVDDNLISIANEAYIVSPVSSLIVLETAKDYERFDIKENEGSLKNASTASAGAVPEPHEWALIILISSTLLFLYYKRKNNLKAS